MLTESLRAVKAIAVVLNLMNAIGRSAREGKQGSMKRRTVGIAGGFIAPAAPGIESRDLGTDSD